jgi:hypothetical protein
VAQGLLAAARVADPPGGDVVRGALPGPGGLMVRGERAGGPQAAADVAYMAVYRVLPEAFVRSITYPNGSPVAMIAC